MITIEAMAEAMPTAKNTGRLDEWYGPLVSSMEDNDVTNPDRIACFLANVAEETGELAAKEENLHYSGLRLVQVFPSLFGNNRALADTLAAEGPEAIANYIYDDANRPEGWKMGNNYPGAGWLNRGRGPMMTTGENNYRAFFKRVGLPPDSDRNLLLQPMFGAEAAAWHWSLTGCNPLADMGAFGACVFKMNGGHTNFATRLAYRHAFYDAMGVPVKELT